MALYLSEMSFMVRTDRFLKFAFGNEPSSTDQTKGGILELSAKQRKSIKNFLLTKMTPTRGPLSVPRYKD
jgi:hypothetical protein